MRIKVFLKNAFSDMKKDAAAQHEVDKANFSAARAEFKASHVEARAMGNPQIRKKIRQEQRTQQIAEADKRKFDAEIRIKAAKNNQ